jgi:RNA polymerase sigma factor (sigma-70 family)
MVEYFVRKNSGTGQDAEDIFQDAMLVIFDRSRETGFELSCSLKTYVYSVARNLWLKKLRSNKGKLNVEDFEDYLPVQVEENEEEDVNLAQKLKEAVETLGENCRKILLLFYYQKMDMQQIAAELGYTSADNAKNQKYKCLQQLKTKVGANA